jgi:hypothetical protein
MKRIATKFVALSMIVLLSGCARQCNRVTANGSVFGAVTGDWIVVTYSGNHITDVWRLKNVMVQSEEHSDGWLFVDDNGNAVHVGGNTKAIRVNDKASTSWDKYVDYHSEFTNQTYKQFADSVNKVK